ncbi:DNA-binding protein [Candidatus Micrarchaeota archaeon]|nr:DNA-binding protein [Candidatus Micrarchaeota archaeon]
MKIKDVKPGNFDFISGKVIEKGETREVNGRFGTLTVADFKVKDASGEIKLSLWGDNIDKVKKGDMIEIKNGWASVFRDELQISLGRNGEMKINNH